MANYNGGKTGEWDATGGKWSWICCREVKWRRERVRWGESKKGMHMGIAVSLGEQLSQTQLHRFFSVVDFCSRFFRRVIAEHSSSVVHYVCTTASIWCSKKSHLQSISYVVIIELDVSCSICEAILSNKHLSILNLQSCIFVYLVIECNEYVITLLLEYCLMLISSRRWD